MKEKWGESRKMGRKKERKREIYQKISSNYRKMRQKKRNFKRESEKYLKSREKKRSTKKHKESWKYLGTSWGNEKKLGKMKIKTKRYIIR